MEQRLPDVRSPVLQVEETYIYSIVFVFTFNRIRFRIRNRNRNRNLNFLIYSVRNELHLMSVALPCKEKCLYIFIRSYSYSPSFVFVRKFLAYRY